MPALGMEVVPAHAPERVMELSRRVPIAGESESGDDNKCERAAQGRPVRTKRPENQVSVSAQMLAAQLSANPDSSSFIAPETPPDPGTVLNVRAAWSYL